MANRRSVCARTTIIVGLVLFCQSLTAQDATAKRILNLSESEQVAFITETMDQGFPDTRADQMTMLILNRSAVSVPLIAARVEQIVNSQNPSQEFINIGADMIAYAGNEASLRALGRLMTSDEKRFGPYVSSTLYHSMNWRNPFTVAYRGVELGDEAVSKYTLQWSDDVLSTDKAKRLWAEALVEKYGGPPTQSDWDRDPIASRLESARREQLREGVLRFAAEVVAKRKSSQ